MSNAKLPEEHAVQVAGTSGGIGQATAKLLAEHGFRVFGTSRNPSGAQVTGFPLLPWMSPLSSPWPPACLM